MPIAFNGKYENNLRYIDWERGAPYVFRSDDFEDLINSSCLFARKFDSTVDREIIEKIENFLTTKEAVILPNENNELPPIK